MATRRVRGGRRALSKDVLSKSRKEGDGRYPLKLMELRLNRLYQEVRRRGGKLPQ